MNQSTGGTKKLLIGVLAGLVLGLGLGLLYAYIISPLKWADVPPQDLRVDYGAYYWELVAESYSKHGDLKLAKKQLGTWTDKRAQAALERAHTESSPELQIVLDSLSKKVLGTTPTPAATAAPGGSKPSGKGGLPTLPLVGGCLLVLVVVVAIGLLIVRMRKRKGAEPVAEEQVPEWVATTRPEGAAPAAPPLGHFVTSYSLGNPSYEESFSIETGEGEFLGECGVSVSELIGSGEPEKVTAFEVWLFDKNDIRTVTKVLMSEHAFNDPDLRASLAPKGEAVLAQANRPMVLETATLRVEAMVTEMSYGEGSLPPNSFFERLTVELVAFRKETGSGNASGVGEDVEL